MLDLVKVAVMAWPRENASSRRDFAEYYAARTSAVTQTPRARLRSNYNAIGCSCPPCGAGDVTSGYWSFMANPGDHCGAGAATSSSGDYGIGFAALARKALRGKRLLVYGDSVARQIHFAMLCDLRANGLMPANLSWWPSSTTAYYKLPWHLGVFVPQLELSITAWGWDDAAKHFCAERERNIRQGHGKVSGAGRHCPAFLQAALEQFDVVLYNFGLHYSPKSAGCNSSAYEDDLHDTLHQMTRAARRRPSARFFFVQTAAQHFRGTMKRSGLYEEADATAKEEKTCFCAPTMWSLDWRNRLLETLAARLIPAGPVRIFPFYNLTQPHWYMHVARTKQQVNGNGMVCDCTHYCYAADFWKLELFPALERGLL